MGDPRVSICPTTSPDPSSVVTYWYEGYCPRTGQLLRLPRTTEAETIAQQLMQELSSHPEYSREGKMYGVLLVETPEAERLVLRAFSGLGPADQPLTGWVPPIPGRNQVALAEAQTLAELDDLKQQLLSWSQAPEWQQYHTLTQEWQDRLAQLAQVHSQRRLERQQERQRLEATLTGPVLQQALEQLNQQSRQDGVERRHMKRQRQMALQPLQVWVEQANHHIAALKQQRKTRSRQLQSQMHAHYHLTNFAGASLALEQLVHQALPTGTGDCCAPKLLHYAASHHLKPLALAEFWWGPASTKGRQPREFYGACAERCQPLLGFLLSGLPDTPSDRPADSPLPILYQDNWLIAVDKPAGLLSVPGRSSNHQDNALYRCQLALPAGAWLRPVHRLDQDTSGVLLFARDLPTYRQLNQQFQERQVYKAYEAILAGDIQADQGLLNLPLWSDPDDRPRQTVDWQLGKPSLTHFRVLARGQGRTRVEFVPLTGRTHQLRVHAAAPEGLGVPILGDRLYGGLTGEPNRLHLHARQLRFSHPQTGQPCQLQAQTPF